MTPCRKIQKTVLQRRRFLSQRHAALDVPHAPPLLKFVFSQTAQEVQRRDYILFTELFTTTKGEARLEKEQTKAFKIIFSHNLLLN